MIEFHERGGVSRGVGELGVKLPPDLSSDREVQPAREEEDGGEYRAEQRPQDPAPQPAVARNDVTSST